MANVHMILQGKGGVGKSFIAAVLAQYMNAMGKKPLCIDTDPVNATFHGYKALNVHKLEIMEGDEINPRHFDALVELLASSKQDVIIDNGASSFVPLSHYLITNHVPALLYEIGHRLLVHTVITGGQALRDTVSGFAQMASQFPQDVSFVVWLNPYWGLIEHEGKRFVDLKACKDHRDQVAAVIEIPALKRETYGHDLSEMLRARRTFEESLQLASLPIMVRQRLKIVRDQLYGGARRLGGARMNSNEKNSLSWERDALDEIIREVAIRHGISVGRDDPILMTYTINRQVMESATGIQKMILNDHLKGLRTLSKELQDEAAGRLEQTMREATNSICLALEQEAKRLFSLQRMENEMVVRKMMEEYRHLQRFSSISFLVSFLGFATALAMLWYTG